MFICEITTYYVVYYHVKQSVLKDDLRRQNVFVF
jgi:hypothetical protein